MFVDVDPKPCPELIGGAPAAIICPSIPLGRTIQRSQCAIVGGSHRKGDLPAAQVEEEEEEEAHATSKNTAEGEKCDANVATHSEHSSRASHEPQSTKTENCV